MRTLKRLDGSAKAGFTRDSKGRMVQRRFGRSKDIQQSLRN